jgi:hypothetical protein
MIAGINLQQLRCVAEEDSSRPYLWPLLLKIDDQVMQTLQLTRGEFASPPEGALALIKDGMRTGDTAPIPAVMSRFGARFEPHDSTKILVLVALLWNDRATPYSAVLAGYEAFLDATPSAVSENLLALKTATDRGPIIAAIKELVSERINAAITDQLDLLDDIDIKLHGADELIDAQFQQIVLNGTDPSTAFTLSFAAGSQHEHQLDCLLRWTADPCEDELVRVRMARQAIADAQKAMNQLIATGENPGTEAKIEKLQAEIQDQQARLDAAQADLARCRTLTGFGGANTGWDQMETPTA